MQNKNAFRGFVPVTGNWDLFGADRSGQTRKNKRGCCPACGQNPCRCARQERAGAAEECAANAYVRETEAAVCTVRTGDSCACNPQRSSGQAETSCAVRYEKDCGCQREYAQPRQNSTGRNDCGAARYERTGSCQQEYAETRMPCNAAGSNGQTPRRDNCAAMVEVQEQEFGEIYRSESALRAGTLFPDLHKPMNGYWPCDENCGTPSQAAAFAAWELRLYLDTHPGDHQAMALLERIESQLGDPNYATTFLPEGSGQNWTWVNDPWPWNFGCPCGK